MNDQDILQRINYEINKRFDERDKSFDRIETRVWLLYPVIIVTALLT